MADRQSHSEEIMMDVSTELATFRQGSIDVSAEESKVGPRSSSSNGLPPGLNAPAIEDHLDPGPPSQEFSLPPVDSGKDAWLFLAACFVMEALIWGESRRSNQHWRLPALNYSQVLIHGQDFPLPMEFSRNTILLMHPLLGQVTLPS
jgi:hypothetical protein